MPWLRALRALKHSLKRIETITLFADVVNDYFDKLRSAEITAKQQADLERMRNQLLIGFDPMVGTESDETPTQRGTELPDLKFRETMTQPDPEGDHGS